MRVLPRMNYLIHNQLELDACAHELLSTLSLPPNEVRARATVLGLSGELGAGKTALVQSLARALAIPTHVTSPTFVIGRFYEIPSHAQFTQLVHIDAYRIEHEDELRPLGFSGLLADPHNLVVVEWPEQLGKRFPSYATRLTIVAVDETTRQISDKKEE